MKNIYFVLKHIIIEDLNLDYYLFHPDWDKYPINIPSPDDISSLLPLLQSIQEAKGDIEKLKKLTTIRPWGFPFYDEKAIDTDYTVPEYHFQFIEISSDGEQASIILNIDHPDILLAYSHHGDIMGDGHDAEIISFQDFLFLIQSWVSEDRLKQEKGDKYIPPQDRPGFQEYHIEVTKTTLKEALAKFKSPR